MAAGKSPTLITERDWLARYFPLPEPHARVRLLIRSPYLGMLHYTGTGEDLVAAGAATPEMLEPGTHGQARLDPAGHPYWRHKRPGGRFTIIRRPRTREAAMRLPGVAEQVRTWPGAFVCAGFTWLSQEDLATFAAEAV